MKILEIVITIEGAVHATVLNCGKIVKVVSPNKTELSKNIRRACSFVSVEDVKIDLQLNFSEYLS